MIRLMLSLVLLRRCINGTGPLAFPSLKNKSVKHEWQEKNEVDVGYVNTLYF